MKKLNIKNLVKLILNEYLTIASSGDGDKYSLDEKSDMISDKVRETVKNLPISDVVKSECKTCSGEKLKREFDGSIVICLDCWNYVLQRFRYGKYFYGFKS